MDENLNQMEASNLPTSEENKGAVTNSSNNTSQIAAAIIVAGILVAGAVLLKGSSGTQLATAPTVGTVPTVTTVSPIATQDQVLGNPSAKVTVILYEDYQCPFCGRFFADSEKQLRDTYVSKGLVQIVYRDYAFLGPESVKAAEASKCASDQGKFWEYHDYLFTHQNGENRGAFADANLKSFAGALNLDVKAFSQCLDSGKYTKAVNDSMAEGSNSGVRGTPKGFILKNGKVVDTIDGAIPNALVTSKIDAALK